MQVEGVHTTWHIADLNFMSVLHTRSDESKEELAEAVISGWLTQ